MYDDTKGSLTNSPPVRTLAWEFDEPKYAPVHDQFLVGSAILVTPVLKRGGKQVTGYLPKAGGPWRDWWTYKVSPGLSRRPEALAGRL